ncbi:hypothetical protein BH11PAT2_BH11PAT2_03410 [soil metagenome]
MDLSKQDYGLRSLEPMPYTVAWPLDHPIYRTKAKHYVLDIYVDESIPWEIALARAKSDKISEKMSKGADTYLPSPSNEIKRKEVLIVGVTDYQQDALFFWAKENGLALSSSRTLLAIAEQFPNLPQMIYGECWGKSPYTDLTLACGDLERNAIIGLKWHAVYEEQPCPNLGRGYSGTKLTRSLFSYPDGLRSRDVFVCSRRLVFERT